MRRSPASRPAGAGVSVSALGMEGRTETGKADQRSHSRRAGGALAATLRANGKRGLGWAAAAAAFFLLAVACGGGGEEPAVPDAGAAIQVVATTALLADLVKNVDGERVEVRSIMPPGADLHSFQATPTDSIAISRARVIVSNGFGLDAFLEPVLRSAKGPGAIHVIAAEGLGPADGQGGGGAGMADDENQGPQTNPHFWQNPLFAIHYVEGIRDGLASADPDHAPDYQANAAAYIEELRKLDREILEILSDVDPVRRHLVAFHSAFSHFAQRYGWKVSAFVASDADDVSPADVVRVLERVRNDRLPAVFVGPQFRSDVIERAAEDAGVTVGTIYSDLSDANVTSYVEMMRFNAKALAEHLR